MTLWDPNMANTAAAIDQAMKMGAVMLKPPRRAGFAPPRDFPRVEDSPPPRDFPEGEDSPAPQGVPSSAGLTSLAQRAQLDLPPWHYRSNAIDLKP